MTQSHTNTPDRQTQTRMRCRMALLGRRAWSRLALLRYQVLCSSAISLSAPDTREKKTPHEARTPLWTTDGIIRITGHKKDTQINEKGHAANKSPARLRHCRLRLRSLGSEPYELPVEPPGRPRGGLGVSSAGAASWRSMATRHSFRRRTCSAAGTRTLTVAPTSRSRALSSAADSLCTSRGG